MARDAPAVHTSRKGLRVPACNVAEFLFANPFCGRDAPAVSSAPLPSQREHCLRERVPPHKPLYINSMTGAQVSWERVRRDAGRVARGLRALPFLQPPRYEGNREPLVPPIVMVQLPNSVVYAPVCFGIWAAGLTASTVNPFLTRDELAHVLRQSRPQAVVTMAGASLETLSAAVDTLDDDALKMHYKTAGCIFVFDPAEDDYGATPRTQALSGVHGWSVRNWKTLLGRGEDEEWRIAPLDKAEAKARIALVMWSSGTSGKSKGVALSHYALVWQMTALWHAMPEFGPDERFLGLPPMYHSFGITVLLMIAPLTGASVLMIPKFDLKTYLELASTFHATTMHVAPPVALLLAKSPLVDQYDLSTIKRAICGGAPLGADIIQQVYKRTGIIVTMGLGMTETAGGTAQQCDLSWEEMQSAPGSTGRFMLGMDAKLVDEDVSIVVKIGEPGEILLRSPMNLSCYLNDPAATNAAISPDGWYRSGDVGVLDEKGNMYIVDRLKDVIKYKGLQVAPAELEGIICACPLVKEAGVCAIFSEAEATELPRAYVVPANPQLVTRGGRVTKEQERFADEVRRHVEKHTVKYKWLRGGIVIVKEIPTSPSGKRLRKLLKQITDGTEIALYEPAARL
ncbi:acetyl-CoA synthetase-like protein [Auricularia subglabra TFB-10046 SS5]|nr:acetyl-CoA synthetase-like protein [Auricularia subglabra TFB-10046 SS5]